MKKAFYLFFVAFLVVVLAACSKPGTGKEGTPKDPVKEEQNGSNGEKEEEPETETPVALEPEEGAELITLG